MSAQDLAFYLFAGLLIASGLLAVTLRDLFRSAIALMAGLLCTAALFLLMQAEFTAMVQIMAYVGGVMVFMLYAVLMTAGAERKTGAAGGLRLASAIVVALTLLTTMGHLFSRVPGLDRPPPELEGSLVSLKDIGARLLSTGPDGFLVPFELVSALLLAALVGAASVALAERQANPPDSKNAPKPTRSPSRPSPQEIP